MADPDEALIEAIAEAILTAYLPVRERFTPWKAASAVSDEQRQTARTYASAAYTAMVEHLGLVEEWGVRFERQADPTMGNPSGVITVEQKVSNEATARSAVKNGALIRAKNRRVVRRLVSRWTEVDHGSE